MIAVASWYMNLIGDSMLHFIIALCVVSFIWMCIGIRGWIGFLFGFISLWAFPLALVILGTLFNIIFCPTA